MRSIKHTAGFEIANPIDQVFPLFSPEGEKISFIQEWQDLLNQYFSGSR